MIFLQNHCETASKRLIQFLGLLFLLSPATVSAGADSSSFYKNFEGINLVDQNNKVLIISSFLGKITLFNFIYTQCPTVCSVQTKALDTLQKSLSPTLRDRVQFISISMDPGHDTPSLLKLFARRMNVNLNTWSFVTGKTLDFQKMNERLQILGNEKSAKESKRMLDHSTQLWLVDTKGRLMQRYSGNPIEVKRLAQEIKQLYEINLADAARPKQVN